MTVERLHTSPSTVDVITHLTMKARYHVRLEKQGLGRTSVEHIDFTRLLSEANVFGASIKTADDITEDKNHRVALKE